MIPEDMFVTDEDYSVVIGDDALKVISRTSAETRSNAELEAVEEISGYLRPVYDCTAIFGAEGDNRNRLIVMYAADIALYNMVASLPQKMGFEIRKERYERAIKWLEGVQSRKIVPDLPLVSDEDDSPTNTVIYHSEPKLRHNW